MLHYKKKKKKKKTKREENRKILICSLPVPFNVFSPTADITRRGVWGVCVCVCGGGGGGGVSIRNILECRM